MENTTQPHTETNISSPKHKFEITIETLWEKLMEFFSKKENLPLDKGYAEADVHWEKIDMFFTYLFEEVILPSVEKWEKTREKDNGMEEKDLEKVPFKLKNPISENPEFGAFLFYMDSIAQFNYNISYLVKRVKKMEERFEKIARHYYLVVNKLGQAIVEDYKSRSLRLKIDELLVLDYDFESDNIPEIEIVPERVGDIFDLTGDGFSLRIYEILRNGKDKGNKYKLLDSKWVI